MSTTLETFLRADKNLHHSKIIPSSRKKEEFFLCFQDSVCSSWNSWLLAEAAEQPHITGLWISKLHSLWAPSSTL